MVILRATCLIQMYLKACLLVVKKKFMPIVRIKANYIKNAYKEKGIRNRVLERAYRNKPLTEARKRLNRMNSGVRCAVERVFGILKLHYGMAKASYLG
ncbi:MAG: hypothetical protein KZQ89_18900 [Candidatus Thiodiazotropha sp. (ex Lucinoma kastoroae)]|nr:hypothetical protein [Candidatus Thiodiazotropha sp. (ex Lucinoma kastoroae)]